jgi:hypothetical protein
MTVDKQVVMCDKDIACLTVTKGMNTMRETRMPSYDIDTMGVPCHSWSGIIFRNIRLTTPNINDLYLAHY